MGNSSYSSKKETAKMSQLFYSRIPTGRLFTVLIVVNIVFLMVYTRNDCLQDIEKREVKIKKLTDELSCKTKGLLPSGGFCMDESNKMVGYPDLYDAKLCQGLEELFGHSTVGDFGSSRGLYGGCFLRLNNSVITMKGKEDFDKLKESFMKEFNKTNLVNKPQVLKSWTGFEAAEGVEKESQGLILTADLSKPLDSKYQFDWVMSLEVGEHIPVEGEQPFIDNLVNHACKGVVVSWAVPGQGGYHHVNLRSNEYIISEMERRGLKNDPPAGKILRGMAELYWYKNTVMVFRFPEAKC